MLVSVVIPIYNEEELIDELLRRVTGAMDAITASHGFATELLLVDDGSRDTSAARIQAASVTDPRIILISLSRNFGHQAALQAGLEHAAGDATIILDGDLQDPPELFGALVESWQAGNHVVVAKRKSRAEKGLRLFLFNSFYKVLGKMSDIPMDLNSGHFSLIDRQALDSFLELRERNRFLPGLRTWVGHKRGTVLYDRDERAAGTPKMSLAHLMKYGFDAIFSFSFKPLRAIWALGFVVSTLAILYAIFLIALRVFHIDVVPGFTTPTVAILFLGGVQLISIGILGEYLGRIYDEVKQRPIYVVGNIFRNGASEFAAKAKSRKGVEVE